ncbi:hypothetical protein NXS19_009473 [Fusarium pseudograminearum]|nr:hypothetical protein NXS19_009473 [Fusarium pseudograminearum]
MPGLPIRISERLAVKIIKDEISRSAYATKTIVFRTFIYTLRLRGQRSCLSYLETTDVPSLQSLPKSINGHRRATSFALHHTNIITIITPSIVNRQDAAAKHTAATRCSLSHFRHETTLLSVH